MAKEALGQLYLELLADASGLKRSIDSALSTTERTLKKTGAKLQSVGASMTKSLTLPIAGMGAGILKMAGDFEKGMNKVAALSGTTGQTFTDLRDQAKELGATTKFSASQAADAMGFLAMAGFEAEEIMGAMPATLSLAAAANLELGESADVVSNILTGYGMTADETAGAVDVLTKAFTSNNTNLTQLGGAMKFVGPVAKSAGVAFEETAAAIGLLGNAGIQGEMAGTALRGAIVRMLSPTKKAAGIARNLGLEFLDASGNLKPLTEILDDLGKSSANTADMMEMFGLRAGPAMLALVDQGAPALKAMTSELENSAGWADKVAGTMQQGLTGSLIQLKSAAEGLAIAIADTGLLEWATGAVSAVTSFVRGLNETNPEILKWGTIIAGMTAAVGPALLALGMLSSGLGAGAAVGAGPLLAIGAAVAAIGASLAFVDLASVRDAIVSQIADIRARFEEWRGNNGELIDNLKSKWEELKTTASESFEKLRAVVADTLAKIGVEFDTSNINFELFMDTAVKALTIVTKGFTAMMEVAVPVIGLVIKAVGKFIVIVKKMHNVVMDVFAKVSNFVVTSAGKFQNAIGGMVSGLEKLTGVGEWFYDKAMGNSWAKDFFLKFFGYSAEFDGKVTKPINEALSNVGDTMPEVENRIRRSTDSINSLLDGLGANLSDVFRTGKFDAQSFLDTVANHFADEAAKAIMEPFKVGFAGIVAESEASTVSISDGFAGMFSTVGNTANNWFSALLNGFSQLGSTASSILGGIGQAVGGVVSGISGAATSTSAQGSSGGGGGWLGAIGSIAGLFFADGGRPPVGQTAVVGERGPELFVPDRPGTIIPNDKIGGMTGSGGASINVTQNFTTGVTRAELSSVLSTMKNEATQAVADAMQRGGSFNRIMRI